MTDLLLDKLEAGLENYDGAGYDTAQDWEFFVELVKEHKCEWRLPFKQWHNYTRSCDKQLVVPLNDKYCGNCRGEIVIVEEGE